MWFYFGNNTSFPLIAVRAQCSQMRPPFQLWTFPPELSVADEAFHKPFIDYQHDLNLDRPQIFVDLESQFLIINAAINAANDQFNGRLACTLTRVLSKDIRKSVARVALVHEIAKASEAIDRQCASISQSQLLHEEVERIGREYNATATKALTSITAAKFWATNRQFKLIRKQFLDRAHEEWSQKHESLSKIHQGQIASNQTRQSLAQKREVTQKIRNQLGGLSDQTQDLQEGDLNQIKNWFWEHVAQRFAEDGKCYTPSHSDAWWRDLKRWCKDCSSKDVGILDNRATASLSTP
ncbi:MAG: hypothetical protein Q9171_001795 [Xanthocarpia ochracea]